MSEMMINGALLVGSAAMLACGLFVLHQCEERLSEAKAYFTAAEMYCRLAKASAPPNPITESKDD